MAALLPAVAGGLWLMAAQPAAAHPAVTGDQAVATQQDGSYDALRAYARDVGLETASATRVPATEDGAYSTLLDFARMVGADEAPVVLAQATAPAKPAAIKSAKPAKPAKPVTKENKGGDGDAYFVGSNKCMTCHAAVAAEFSATLMGRIGKTTRKGTMECENCHGPGSKHVAAGGGRGVGGINGFRATDGAEIEANNAVCLTCHEKGERTAWKGSTHDTRGLACTNCHTVMRNVTPKNQLAKVSELEVCFQCHKDRRAQLYRSSHMPLREGKMVCSDCHNPHGSVNGTDALIREASINDNCYKCHAEKRGPFLWEHSPVREDCLNCHDAHGSTNEYLLKIQRPKLCAECHGFDHGSPIGSGTQPQYHFSFYKGCGNCHVKIHGSNHPSGRYFER